jgi:hypothetical protein
LLSQTPDLFSQRFTENISKTQNYYRQVGRDDPWVQALLCAAAPTDPDAPEQRVGESRYNLHQICRTRQRASQLPICGWSSCTLPR